MEITDVQVNICSGGEDRLKAYCAVVFDNSFVVHNVRVIEKPDGLLIAMPSRKLTSKCPNCQYKSPIDNCYCGNCGTHLRSEETVRQLQRDTKIHFDVAHPINADCRQQIESAVTAAYLAAISRTSEVNGRELSPHFLQGED